MSLNQFEEIYTPAEVAEAWGVSPNTIYALLKSGELKGFRIGTPWKIPASAVREYVLTKSGLK